jgi:serine/threonine protein kinase
VPTDEPLTEDHFDKIQVLGKGGFGKVVLCKFKKTEEFFAVKILEKYVAVTKNTLESIRREKEQLIGMQHPFLLSLDFCFHSKTRIFMGMKYCQGGDFFTHINLPVNGGCLPEASVKFYTAQLVLALEYLHSKNTLHRDLKEENICMYSNGYVCLVDYGISKTLPKENLRTNTDNGTANYKSPEILAKVGYGLEVDWWALGVFVAFCITGQRPFDAAPGENNEEDMKLNIKYKQWVFPAGKNLSPEGQNFIERLLDKNLETRMVNNQETGMLREHDWFKGLDWAKLLKFEIEAPFIPKLKGLRDTRFFKEFEMDRMGTDQIEIGSTELRLIAKEDWSNFEVPKK